MHYHNANRLLFASLRASSFLALLLRVNPIHRFPRLGSLENQDRYRASQAPSHPRSASTKNLPNLSIVDARLSGDDGFILPLFLVICFILLVGAVMLVSRSGAGLVSGAYSSQSRLAEKAAKTGANYIISQFNKPVNRRLLVSNGSADNEASTSVGMLSTSSLLDPIRRNPCASSASLEPDPDYTSIYPSSSDFPRGNPDALWYIQADGSISKTPSNLAFRVVGVKRQDIDNLRIARNRAAGGTTSFILQVEGQVLRGNSLVAKATLEQEYDVAPKCCGVPYGGAHGAADYRISNGTSLCLLGDLGLGILAGAAENDAGLITIRGSANSFVASTSDGSVPVNPIYCLYNGNNPSYNCGTPSGSNTTIDVIPGDLNPPPTWSSPTVGTSALASPAPTPQRLDSCSLNVTKSGGLDLYQYVCGDYRYPSTPSSAELTSGQQRSYFMYCSGSYLGGSSSRACSGLTVINPGATNLPGFCGSATRTSTGVTTQETHCNLSKIEKGDYVVDTTSKRLVLYFPPSGYVIGEVGNSGAVRMQHCIRSASESLFSPSTCQPPTNIINLTLFGFPVGQDFIECTPANRQLINLGGNTSFNAQAFFYFPCGDISLTGNPSISGVMWANTLSSGGNSTWTVPGSGLASVLDLMQMNPTGDDRDALNPIKFEMVARSLNKSRWISK